MWIEINSKNQVMGYSDNETSNAVMTDKVVPPITDIQILKFVDNDFVVEDSQALIDKKAEYDAQEYARNRATEYPAIGDQLDYIFHNGVAKWKTDMIEPVKAKYPKPS